MNIFLNFKAAVFLSLLGSGHTDLIKFILERVWNNGVQYLKEENIRGESSITKDHF